jgi:hypothetical protein
MKMPARLPDDGLVRVSRLGDDFIALDSTHAGKEESLVVSEYNAWRIFGLLSVMLHLPLSKAVNKAIQMGGYGPGSMTFSRPLPPNPTLGDRVAANLAHEKTVDLLRAAGYPVTNAAWVCSKCCVTNHHSRTTCKQGCDE